MTPNLAELITSTYIQPTRLKAHIKKFTYPYKLKGMQLSKAFNYRAMNKPKTMNKIKSSQLILLSVLLIALPSCTKEDRSDCPTDNIQVVLSFYPTLSIEEGNDINLEDLQTLDVYLFRQEDGIFHSYCRDYEADVNNEDYRLKIAAKQGIYDMIVWGNAAKSDYNLDPLTFIVGETNIEDIKIKLQNIKNQVIDREISHLFYGQKLAYEITGEENQEVAIPLVQNTYTFEVNIKHIPKESELFKVLIEAKHDTYDLWNKPYSNQEFVYAKVATPSGPNLKQQTAILRTLNIYSNSTLKIKVYDWSGKEILSKPLVQLLQTAAENAGGALNLDLIHKYVIDISFGQTEVETIIKVNGWDAFKEEQDLEPQS